MPRPVPWSLPSTGLRCCASGEQATASHQLPSRRVSSLPEEQDESAEPAAPLTAGGVEDEWPIPWDPGVLFKASGYRLGPLPNGEVQLCAACRQLGHCRLGLTDERLDENGEYVAQLTCPLD